ncbi:unnamed protein product [Linum trigynum]|uniref:Uncharacterized protein n=1 Tax=Linum trigynum TaxID=586398 RepID=A0AAV2FLM0_9ROSI
MPNKQTSAGKLDLDRTRRRDCCLCTTVVHPRSAASRPPRDQSRQASVVVGVVKPAIHFWVDHGEIPFSPHGASEPPHRVPVAWQPPDRQPDRFLLGLRRALLADGSVFVRCGQLESPANCRVVVIGERGGTSLPWKMILI